MELKKRIYKRRKIKDKDEIKKQSIKDKPKKELFVKIEESTEEIKFVLEL